MLHFVDVSCRSPHSRVRRIAPSCVLELNPSFRRSILKMASEEQQYILVYNLKFFFLFCFKRHKEFLSVPFTFP